jgi:hypothetical protein
MIRSRVLIAAFLCLPLLASAQSIPMKAIACTVENPEFVRGDVKTIYFSEPAAKASSAQVLFQGELHKATVTFAEISFCHTSGQYRTCYNVSRIAGRFTATVSGSSPYQLFGICLPEGSKPQF